MSLTINTNDLINQAYDSIAFNPERDLHVSGKAESVLLAAYSYLNGNNQRSTGSVRRLLAHLEGGK